MEKHEAVKPVAVKPGGEAKVETKELGKGMKDAVVAAMKKHEAADPNMPCY
jgi:hypothetical protein